MQALLGVIAANEAAKAPAAQLASELNAPLLESGRGFFSGPEQGLVLEHDGQQLALYHSEQGPQDPLRIDLDSIQIQMRVQDGKQQPFARALGLHKRKQPRVLDATTGLGRDAAVLSALGCQVTMLERNPLLHLLLDNALQRSAGNLHKRLSLAPCMDALAYLATGQHWDVIYLDPMFPQQRRKALPKKEAQWLTRLATEADNSAALLTQALGHAERVVVKRGPRSAVLAGIEPQHRIATKRLRYDVYFPQQMPSND